MLGACWQSTCGAPGRPGPSGSSLTRASAALPLPKRVASVGRSEARGKAEHRAELAVKEREAQQLREEKHALKERAARSEGKLARAFTQPTCGIPCAC